MATVRHFKADLSLRQLVPIWNSIGAHVAAKLQHFGSDERTLTDEACDMFYIWAHPNRLHDFDMHELAERDRRFRLLSPKPLRVEVVKSTQRSEAETGEDLAVTIAAPEGAKRAVFQAKVLDPDDDCLRYDSAAGWTKLRDQLRAMQQHNGDLSFLLVYVPMSNLDGAEHGFGTWEQGFERATPRSGTSSRFGTTVFPVDTLLTPGGDWTAPHPVIHTGKGQFQPRGISLTRVLVDMIACRRGRWSDLRDDPASPERLPPARELDISFRENDREAWAAAVASLNQTDETQLW